MIDPRQQQLAANIVSHSIKVQPGEKVLIENTGLETAFVTELVKAVYKAGGVPYVNLHDAAVERALMMGCTEEQLEHLAERDARFMDTMDAYISVRAGDNSAELSDVPDEKSTAYRKIYVKKVHFDSRIARTKWVVMRWPSPSMAQEAAMSTEAFDEFYFRVCNLDYSKMGKAMEALVRRMERTDKVRLVGNGTDLSFSIKGLPAIPCAGELNIPDGEVFTAPVRESVNGVIQYNTASRLNGFTYQNVRLVFEDGKIVEATCNDNKRINEVFDTDPGARYVGEFAIGVNPYILHPMLDTLFDEKIAGSIHFTPGACYDECDNGNKSALHWDLVLIQRADYGGGEMYFDDQLVRKDGIFLTEELQGLNPQALTD